LKEKDGDEIDSDLEGFERFQICRRFETSVNLEKVWDKLEKKP
jgi:hypothetical protein